MAELDLIPDSYRRARLIRRWLKAFALVYIGLIVSLGVSRWLLASAIDARAGKLEQIDADRAAMDQQKGQIQDLDARKAELARKVDALETLRGGPSPRAIFVAVDRALNGEVWFLQWTFRRAGEFVQPQPRSVNTGYIITVPAGEAGAQSKAYRIATHMEINGQASSHSALADFVQRLSEQSVVEEVKVLNTHVRPYGAFQVVDFSLAVIIKG
jgi:Tfp pilus assembly protein PilN